MALIPKILSIGAILVFSVSLIVNISINDFKPVAQFPFDPTQTDEEILPGNLAYYQGQVVNIPPFTPPESNPVLGDTTDTTAPVKKIQVDLTRQRLYAFEGEKLVYNFLISSGINNWTPTGKFKVWTKIRSQKMSGGSKEKGTYYYLPNVPYIMFFYNDKIDKRLGYSLHGTYWHNNFGVPMSHGCINMKTEDAQKIYYWINPQLRDGRTSIAASQDNPGTEIIIYGKYNPLQTAKSASSDNSR